MDRPEAAGCASGRDRTVWHGDGPSQLIGWSGALLHFSRQILSGAPFSGPEIWVWTRRGPTPTDQGEIRGSLVIDARAARVAQRAQIEAQTRPLAKAGMSPA